MKFLVVLGAVFVAQGALANEVGTHNPKSVETPETTLELALAENGAGTSWADKPLEFQATTHQTAKLNQTVDAMNAEVTKSLDELIAEKLEKALNN